MKRSTLVNVALLLGNTVLVVVPLVLVDGTYGGADAMAIAAITAEHPDYVPWFSSIFTPPSPEIASGLFALQAAIGAGFLGYYFGVAATKRRMRVAKPDDRT